MFDIKEYYHLHNQNPKNIQHEIENINDDLSYDIDAILKNTFNSLYIQDRYKYKDKFITIIYPKLQYQGNRSLLLNPDKVRFLMSFYPSKSDLSLVEKIILRPRYIENDNIELVALYLRQKKTLVLYITHPHNYVIQNNTFETYSDLLSLDLEKILNNKLLGNVINAENEHEIKVHPVWYMLYVLSQSVLPNEPATASPDTMIDKFFIKRNHIENSLYEALNSLSFYFSQHGY